MSLWLNQAEQIAELVFEVFGADADIPASLRPAPISRVLLRPTCTPSCRQILAALRTADEPAQRERVALDFVRRLCRQSFLDGVEDSIGDQRLMCPLDASAALLNPPSVKRVSHHSAEGLLRDGSALPRDESERRDLSNDVLNRYARGEKLKRLGDERCPLRVDDDGLRLGLVKISDWRYPEPSALFNARVHPEFRLLGQAVAEKLIHRAEDVLQQPASSGVVERRFIDADELNAQLRQLDNRLSLVEDVAGEAGEVGDYDV